MAMKTLVKILVVALVGAGIGVGVGRMMAPVKEALPTTPLAKLDWGNRHFAQGKLSHPHTDPETRQKLAYEGQHPFAVVLTCADSRVPPEIIFDQGLGDLFVVRVAGNVPDALQIASVEYAVEHLETPLLVVLGHTQCGAVKATVESQGKNLPGSLPALVAQIEPAYRKVRANYPHLKDKALVERVIRQNVLESLLKLWERSPIVQHLAREGKLTFAGGVYDLKEGTVEWLELPEELAPYAAPLKGAKEGSPGSKTHSAGSDAPPQSGAHGH